MFWRDEVSKRHISDEEFDNGGIPTVHSKTPEFSEKQALFR